MRKLLPYYSLEFRRFLWLERRRCGPRAALRYPAVLRANVPLRQAPISGYLGANVKLGKSLGHPGAEALHFLR